REKERKKKGEGKRGREGRNVERKWRLQLQLWGRREGREKERKKKGEEREEEKGEMLKEE
ncbi:hypothetical protein GW17_00056715, partial [Ensete ventricosum]